MHSCDVCFGYDRKNHTDNKQAKERKDRELLTNEDELTFDCYRESLPAVPEWIESAKTNTA